MVDRTADPRPYGKRATMPDKVWVGRDAVGGLLIYPRMPDHRQAAEYMRTLSREEVDQLSLNGGVDTQQLIHSLERTIEGQRKHIRRLQEQLQAAEHELGMPATEEPEPDSFRTLGISEKDFLP